DLACAKCRVPEVGPAPWRCWHCGFQHRSRISHTGFQYCAVDSITTSSTCCSRNHSARMRNCSDVADHFRRSNFNPSAEPTSATTTAKTFLCTSIEAILKGICSPEGSAERALIITRQGYAAISDPGRSTTPRESHN